jgi:hypothetical protein
VVIQSDLGWGEHVQTVVGSANKVWGMIRRICGWGASNSLYRMLYQTLVRSRLEYGTTVWDSHHMR